MAVNMLVLHYDPPVCGVELRPYVSVIHPTREVRAAFPVFPNSAKPVSVITSDTPHVAFEWLRSDKRLCSRRTCTRAGRIQCVTCLKLELTADTYFCSADCMRQCWSKHRALHTQEHEKRARARQATYVQQFERQKQQPQDEASTTSSHNNNSLPSLPPLPSLDPTSIDAWLPFLHDDADDDDSDVFSDSSAVTSSNSKTTTAPCLAYPPSAAPSPAVVARLALSDVRVALEPNSSLLPLYSRFPPPPLSVFETVSRDRCYTPTTEDIGCSLRLRCVPMLEAPTDAADGTNSSSSAAASSNTNTTNNNTPLQLVPGKTHSIDTQHVIGPPGLPPARHVLSSQHYATAQPMNVLKVLDYNVLAHCYATRQMYPYCPPWALSWEYRRDRILREIRSYRADIVCLQEVQANHFEQFFLPQMQQAGYEGYHKRKTRDTVGDDPDEIDGCATFFRRDRFQLVEHHDIEYNTLARQQVSDRKGLRRLLKGNVAHVLVLEDLPARRSSPRRRRFCVANTHMFWDPDQADVKLWQTWVLMQELEKLTLSRNLPLVLCGDFNSMADSAVYELVTAQQVSSANPDSEDPFSILPSRAHVSQHGWLAHHLPLTSAYAAVGEPKFTNYTQHFVGCLDYVFFSRSHLRLVSCVQMEDEANLREYTALPSPVYPSDHLPLIVEMEFLPDR